MVFGSRRTVVVVLAALAACNGVFGQNVFGTLEASLDAGSLAGTSFTVAYSYDASQVNAIGESYVVLSSIDFTLLGANFTKSYLTQGGQVIFENGIPNNVTASFQGAPPSSPVNNITFGFGGPGVIGYVDLVGNFGAGSFRFTPRFFAGEVTLGSGVYYLQFPDNNLFGYYNFPASSILYHYDMGYDAFVPGSASDIYLYDFTGGHWWYTSNTLFPYLYDFTLNTWVYYFPNTTNPGHYTSNPRYFSNLTTGKIFTM
jgi:hypothetical protein